MDGVSTRLPAPKSAPAKPPPEQEKLGHGWNHVVRGGRVVKAQASPSPPSTLTDTGRRSKRQAAPVGGQRKSACPSVSAVESQSNRYKQTDSASPPPQGQSPLEGFADRLPPNNGKSPASCPQNRNPSPRRVWFCSVGQTGKSLEAGLLDHWWCSRQEAWTGTVSKWARPWYFPPERDAPSVG
jgi:hypothetical protein